MSEILNALQTAQVKTIRIARSYLSKKKSITDTYEPFKEEQADFESNCDKLDKIIPQKDGDAKTAGVDDQDKLKELIGEQAYSIASLVRPYAKKYSNNLLKTEFKFNRWTIIGLTQTEVSSYITQKMSLLTPLLADANFMKYNVTAEVIKTVTDNAALYNKNIGDAANTSNEVSIANADINKIIKAAYENLAQMDDLVSYFKTTEPEFYEGYIKNTRRQYPAVRATAMSGFVFGKDGKPLANCGVRIVGTDFSTVTDSTGFYKLNYLPVGNYQALACNEGGDSKSLDVLIIYRHTVKYNFNLS